MSRILSGLPAQGRIISSMTMSISEDFRNWQGAHPYSKPLQILCAGSAGAPELSLAFRRRYTTCRSPKEYPEISGRDMISGVSSTDAEAMPSGRAVGGRHAGVGNDDRTIAGRYPRAASEHGLEPQASSGGFSTKRYRTGHRAGLREG